MCFNKRINITFLLSIEGVLFRSSPVFKVYEWTYVYNKCRHKPEVKSRCFDEA